MAICADSARWSHPAFLRRFGGGGQLGVLFGQRIKRGFLLTFSLHALLVQRGNLADSARVVSSCFFLRRFGGGGQLGVLFLVSGQSAPTARGLSHPAFLCRFGAARGSRFFPVSVSIVDFCRFSLCSFCVFSAAICNRQRAGGLIQFFLRRFDSGGQLGVLLLSASSAVVCPLSFCARCLSMRRSAPSASSGLIQFFCAASAAAASSAFFFSQRAHGGSFAALFLYTLFTLSLQRGDLRRQFARRFSVLFSAALAAALSSAFCFRRALIVLSVLF